MIIVEYPFCICTRPILNNNEIREADLSEDFYCCSSRLVSITKKGMKIFYRLWVITKKYVHICITYSMPMILKLESFHKLYGIVLWNHLPFYLKSNVLGFLQIHSSDNSLDCQKSQLVHILMILHKTATCTVWKNLTQHKLFKRFKYENNINALLYKLILYRKRLMTYV